MRFIKKKSVMECVKTISGRKRIISRRFYLWLDARVQTAIEDVVKRTGGNKRIEGF